MLMFTVRGQNDFYATKMTQFYCALARFALRFFLFFARVEIFIFKSLKMAHKFIVKVTKGGQSEGNGNILEICLAKSLWLK